MAAIPKRSQKRLRAPMQIEEILKDFELHGQSLIIENLDEEEGEVTTDSGIILAEKVDEVADVKKGKVLKANKGYYTDNGIWIDNPIKENAIIYYKVGWEFRREGIKFTGTQISQVVAYKNEG